MMKISQATKVRADRIAARHSCTVYWGGTVTRVVVDSHASSRHVSDRAILLATMADLESCGISTVGWIL